MITSSSGKFKAPREPYLESFQIRGLFWDSGVIGGVVFWGSI